MIEVPIITCVISGLGFIACTRLKRGRVLSPIAIFILVFVSIFGIRPILMVRDDDFDFYGINSESGYHYACVVGLVALISLLVGFELETVRLRRSGTPDSTRNRISDSGRVPARSNREELLSMNQAALGAVGGTLAWIAIIAVLGGGVAFIPIIFGGRSVAVATVLNNTPVAIQTLPIGGCVVLSVTAALIQRERPLSRLEWVVYLLAGGSTLAPSLALGNRRFLIPCIVLILLGALYRGRRKYISLRMAIISTLTVFVLIAIPFVRSAGARAPGQSLFGAMIAYFGSQGVGGSLHDYFLSYDTEMFSYISVIGPQLGRAYPLGMGHGLVGDVLTQPLPARIAPGLWSDHLLTLTFGGGCSHRCPVSSLPGIACFDFGLPGVIVVLALAGVLFARVDRAVESSSGFKLLVTFLLVAFSPALARGDMATQLWIMANSVVLGWALYRISQVQWITQRPHAVGPLLTRHGPNIGAKVSKL